MLPILLDLKYIKIYTYGIFFVLAFFWGSFLFWKNIQLTSYKEEDMFDDLFMSLFGGLFVGRLVHVILHFNKFGFDFIKFILINGYPGINLYGSLAGAYLTFFLFCRVNKIKFSQVVDYTVSPLLAALGLAKIGAFFSGVEVGSRANFFLTIKYANYDGLRHLTPFYEGLFFLAGAYFAYKILFEVRRQKYYEGFVFNLFWWYTGLILALFSGIKANQTYVLGYNFTTMVSSIILLTLTVYFIYYWRVLILRRIQKLISFSKTNGHAKK